MIFCKKCKIMSEGLKCRNCGFEPFGVVAE